MASSRYDLKAVARDDLISFIAEHVRTLTEEEALAVLENPYVTPAIIQRIAQVERLAAYYSVRLRMVAHRLTPQAYAVKFVHYLFWFDLVRLSVEVTVPAPVRRAIDAQLVARAGELTVGERIASARRCSSALIKVFLFDNDARVFEALLVNQRLREDDLLHLASSTRATPEKLAPRVVCEVRTRYAIREARLRWASVQQTFAIQHGATSEGEHACLRRTQYSNYGSGVERLSVGVAVSVAKKRMLRFGQA